MTTLRTALRDVLSLSIFLFVWGAASTGILAQDPPPNPRVVVETTEGDITIELFRTKRPVSVVNFLTYVQDGYYDGTIFHRVIRGFMVQGGGLTEDLEAKTDGLRGFILNEADATLRNRRGTVAMARLGEPNSARAQFFINTEHNAPLDHKNGTAAGFGYAVFGEVVEGMDVVEDIERARTHRVGDLADVPREAIVINTIRRLN
jgi:cyclophilin family peptidyl-prolyl cis-trans isomerase